MDLFRIQLDTSELKRFGLEKNTELNSSLRRKMDVLSVHCVNAFKTSVPVDLGSLRNQKIDYALYTDSVESTLGSRVFVDDSPHLGRRSYMGKKGELLSSSRLAEALQQGRGANGRNLKRSKDSEPAGVYSKVFPEFSPTSGWITEGQNLFITNYKKMLNG